MTNKRNGTLYIGVTNNIQKRIWQHKNHLVDGFTSKYDVTKLVYYEVHEGMDYAIAREKQLKKWNRKWKIDLIEKNNCEWSDLSVTWIPDQVGNDKKTGVG
jgi:putative endonuclease